MGKQFCLFSIKKILINSTNKVIEERYAVNNCKQGSENYCDSYKSGDLIYRGTCERLKN